MAKINILPSKVYNRIAAGEVVDRPCSVVKELVENSIDAGATEIEIHIEQGGKQLIRVVDNGCGIEREDLQSAFLPHATSKIAQAEDLDNIMTLGFRGEAIASISAVSQMTITSKTKEGKCYALSCNGGELGQITEGTGQNGTEVLVEMLFYHTPVRLGFLKSDKVEETEITSLVSRFILNRSDISFTYYANGKKVLQSFGGGDDEAMVSVYGAATLGECFGIQAEKHGIRLRGYIGNQNFYKANKSYQSVFLNGRYIVNATVTAALSNAYSSYLMKRQYPFYVLHIDMPTEIVDVNVHPNKSDVRFADNQVVYGCLYSVVSAVLDGHTKGLDYIVKMPTQGMYEENPPIKTVAQPQSTRALPKGVAPASTAGFVFSYEDAKKEIEESAPAFTAKKQGLELPFAEVKNEKTEKESREEQPPMRTIEVEYPFPKGFIPKEYIGVYEGRTQVKKDANAKRKNPFEEDFPDLYFDPAYNRAAELKEEDPFTANKRYLEGLEKGGVQPRIDVEHCVYVGKLFNTYLLYEYGDTVYIIDQHAAHERLLFNKLKDRLEAREIVRQPMLIPFSIRLNAFESAFIRENYRPLEEIGFVISEAEENIFEISQIPADLQYIDLYSFMHGILAEINGYRAIKLADLVRDKLASAACKAAVKAGMDLTRMEIDMLFAMMDGDVTLKCPHGRPVVIKMKKNELEKKFKRIV